MNLTIPRYGTSEGYATMDTVSPAISMWCEIGCVICSMQRPAGTAHGDASTSANVKSSVCNNTLDVFSHIEQSYDA